MDQAAATSRSARPEQGNLGNQFPAMRKWPHLASLYDGCSGHVPALLHPAENRAPGRCGSPARSRPPCTLTIHGGGAVRMVSSRPGQDGSKGVLMHRPPRSQMKSRGGALGQSRGGSDSGKSTHVRIRDVASRLQSSIP